jgi:hypothetical protein
MKLRLRADTMRLRLTQGEVACLGEGMAVREVTHFPNGTSLVYILTVGDNLPEGGSRFDVSQAFTDAGVEITVTVPAASATRWAQSQQVGIAGDDAVAVGPLQVLIEKDFACLAPRADEPQADTFPNPKETQV